MPKPKLTREGLERAMQPPNLCRVKAFRDTLDAESQALLDEALAYDKRDLSAGGVRQYLLDAGYPEEDVPGVDALTDHRSGRRPCRCRG